MSLKSWLIAQTIEHPSEVWKQRLYFKEQGVGLVTLT